MSQAGLFDDDDNGGGENSYQRHKRRANERQREQSAGGRDIGPLPPVGNPARRAACAASLRLHCETYHRETFALEWSQDHLRAISKLEEVIRSGGTYCLAMPRGSGKTALELVAAEWAVLNGYRRFVVLIGATKADSRRNAASIKTRIECNELLGEDYPEACYPIRRLEGINNRAPGQTLGGRLTRIKWTAEELALPDVEGSKSAGARLYTRGISGAIRGLQDVLPNGETIRPDLVLIDDPQTEKTAKSPPTIAQREEIINGAVLGLAGPGKQIAGFAAVTVIYPEDLAARMLDRERSPEWQGDRCQLLRAMPRNLEFWHRYKDLRRELVRAEEPLEKLTEFYLANRAEADAGADPSWPARYLPWQASAIQFGMDLWAKNEAVFLAEYQNTPRVQEVTGAIALKPADLADRCDGVPVGIVPDWAEYLTAFVDVQQDALFWLVAAWNKQLRGHVVEFGTLPDQGRGYFTLADVRRTLQERYKAATVAHALQAGLAEAAEMLLGRTWQTQTRGSKSVDLLAFDANWAESTDLVYQLARTTAGGKILPHHGRYFGAATIPMESWKRERGDKAGPGWRLQLGRRGARHVVTDVNQWKTTIAQRLTATLEPSGIGFPGSRFDALEMLADHVGAEYAVATEGRGRRVLEWKLRPGRDNHYWDCLVGCGVLASICGAELPGQDIKPERRRVSFAAMQQAARAKR